MKNRFLFVAGVLLVLGASTFGVQQYFGLMGAYEETRASSTALAYESSVLTEKLKASETQNNDLKTLLQARQQEKDQYGQEVQTLSSTVGVLDKLAKTDKQLLEKYSSVYFLNENYIPQFLNQIDTRYLNRSNKPEEVIAGVMPHLNDLLSAAQNQSLSLQILSAYRSFGTQANLKSNYKVTYGAGTANSFSADQGYSEHQLGTAVDFTTVTGGATLTSFAASPAYPWLLEHAYQYGFILSYPKGNTHFVFEPWHWRYVGVELAKKLHNEGKTFYDLDQREIDTYLIKFFD